MADAKGLAKRAIIELPRVAFWLVTVVGGLVAWLNEDATRKWMLHRIAVMDFPRTLVLIVVIAIPYLAAFWWAHSKPKSGRELHQLEMDEIGEQLNRAMDYLDTLKLDRDLPEAERKVGDMISQADAWIEGNLGSLALAKFRSRGQRAVYLWDGDHEIPARHQRIELMNVVKWRFLRLKELYESSEWDGEPPLGKRDKPSPIRPWREIDWLTI